MIGTVASVMTLLMTVGLPYKPTSAGTSGFARTMPRLPSSDSSSACRWTSNIGENAEAVSALARGECELAGFHLPIGPFRSTCAEIYRPYLEHQLIHLTRRTQGLFLPKGNPKGIEGLRDLGRGDMRFVNRQPGSGTHMLLDLSLRGVGVDPYQINGYATTEFTHSAIAAFVASGMADRGIGVQPAAHHFGLDFIRIVSEDYFFRPRTRTARRSAARVRVAQQCFQRQRRASRWLRSGAVRLAGRYRRRADRLMCETNRKRRAPGKSCRPQRYALT